MTKVALILFVAGLIMACNSEKTVNVKEEIVPVTRAVNVTDKETLIKNIDNKVTEIKAIAEADLTIKQHQLLGGGRTFYVNKENKLIKIKAEMLGAAMTLETTFYLDNEALIFVEEVMTDYKQNTVDNPEKTYKENGKIYFDKNFIFDYKTDSATLLNEEELKQKGEILINNFNTFVNEYKSL